MSSILGLSLCMSLSHAASTVPQFSQFPVKVYNGSTAALDLTDPNARMFRTRLSDALKTPVNFAGEYVVTMWGCGAMCRSYTFVSKRTGKLLEEVFGGEGNQEDVIDAKANSKLLVTAQDVHDFENNGRLVKTIVRFYILEKGHLKLIKKIEK
ncbi:hypothetical protein I2F62_03120 [Acinetobacter sp. MD2(2019)]|nr:hypothetical protein [Acinetobacter sp. MD2(2019)]